ncbi:MAG: hypothetical protein WBP13_09590 [Methylophilaceae bacterium]
MIKLINRLFKADSELNYILPKYQPAPLDMVSAHVANTDYYITAFIKESNLDEMQIDNIYGCS